MRIRSRRRTPAHAPAWVRPRHWPAAAGIAGMAVLAAAVLALDDGTSPTARPVQVAAAKVATAVHAGAAAQQLPTSAGSTAVTHAPVVIGDVATAAPSQAASVEQLLAPGSIGDHAAPSDGATVSGLASGGIPLTALEAYRRAATHELVVDPGCHLPWPLLAGIGRVESNHGRYGGAVLLSDGTSTRRILGIPLDGSRSATITDTDHGRLDGDPIYDRALGPMQFIPSTWASYGADGNGDGRKDPFNIFDAAAAAAHYLCAAGGNLSTLAGQTRAVLAYNHSSDYLALVLNLEHAYAVGVPGLVVPVLPPQSAPPSGASTSPTPRPGHKPPPPVDPGPPLSAPSGPTPPHPVGSTTSTRTSPTPRPTSAAPTSSAPGVPSTSASTTPSTSSAPSCPPGETVASSDASDTPSVDASDTAGTTTSSTPSNTVTSTDAATSMSASGSVSSSGTVSSSGPAPTCPPPGTTTSSG